MKRGATVSKREFLQRSAAVAAASAIGVPPEMGLQDAWAEGFQWVNQRCTHCGLACKMNIGMQNGEAIAVRKDTSASSEGALCFEAAKVLVQATNSAEYHRPQKHSMCIAGVVFTTTSGRARDVALRMINLYGLEITGMNTKSQVTAVMKRGSFASLEQSVNYALADDDIEHLLPTFFGWY